MQRLIQEMQVEYAAKGQADKVPASEQKIPIPISEDGLDDMEDLLTICTENMNPSQKQRFLAHWRKLSEQQKESSAASDPLAVDDKSPESEHPDRS